jgi:hypothetical protein
MIPWLLRFSFSTVCAELWPVPCCYTSRASFFSAPRAGTSERHSLPHGPRPPGACALPHPSCLDPNLLGDGPPHALTAPPIIQSVRFRADFPHLRCAVTLSHSRGCCSQHHCSPHPVPRPARDGGLGQAGVCPLEMSRFCAGPACGSWATRLRPSPPALLPPSTHNRAPVLPIREVRRILHVEDGAAGHPDPLPIASNADSEGRWQWRDTLFIERGSEATVRIRYEDFEGTFVACSATTTPPQQRQLHLPILSDGSRR